MVIVVDANTTAKEVRRSILKEPNSVDFCSGKVLVFVVIMELIILLSYEMNDVITGISDHSIEGVI